MKIFTLIFTFLFFTTILLMGAFFYILWHFGKDLPDYRQLSEYEPSVVSRVYAGNGALLKEYSIERRVFVPIDVIPKKIISAFLSAEDKDFYDHFGVDILAISRAFPQLFRLIREIISGIICLSSMSLPTLKAACSPRVISVCISASFF